MRFLSVWATLFLLLPLTAAASPAEAKRQSPAWETVITGHEAIPPRMIAVDKSKQRLFVLESRSPLRMSRMYVCTTGQVQGDKQVQGDLKTPEGIYFVVQRLTSGLDFTLYGNEAYTLNYPNPIDRLRKKTGYGIWIHGRGETISPLQTQGCVALNNTDLEVLGKILLPGTPVALTSSFTPKQGGVREDTAEVRLLRKKVKDWAHAWSSRSASLFDFYDQKAYSLAQGESFSGFQAQKARLFKQLPWIRTTVSNVQVLQGPGYWVTWFHQDYKAPNLSTNGIRRLYWGKTAKGEFRILGMEWTPGMSAGTLLASAEPAFPPLETSPMSEEQAVPLPQALAETETAKLGAPAAEPELAHPAPAAALRTPSSVVEVRPEPSSSALEQYLANKRRGSLDHIEDPAFGPIAAPPQAKALREKRIAAASDPVPAPADAVPGESPISMVQEDSPANALHLPPALPSQRLAGSPPLQALASVPDTPRYPAPPLLPEQPLVRDGNPLAGQPRHEIPTETAEETLAAAEVPPATAHPDPESAVASPPAPESRPKPASPASPVPGPAPASPPGRLDSTASAKAVIEEWRNAWQSGNLNAYMKHYANDAVQGARKSAKSIRKQKKNLWAQVAPRSVTLDNVRLVRKGDTVEATMRQVYKDRSGKWDKGVKVLTLKRISGEWRIIREEWSDLR